MSVSYMKLLAPFVGSVIALIGLTQASIETLGMILKYGGGLVLSAVIGVYLLVGGYALLYRGLTQLGNLAWGDVLERHMYTDEEITEDDIPHWSRIWIAYAASLIREWISGNIKWVSFNAYYDDMVTPIIEEYKVGAKSEGD